MILSTLTLLGITVTLPMESHVRGTEVLLGEVAVVTGEDAALVEQVNAISLGYAPSPGYSRLFYGQRLEQIVERSIGQDVRFAGQRACRVHPSTVAVTSMELRAAAEAKLKTLTTGSDAKWELVYPIPDLQIPAGSVAHRIEALASEGDLRTGQVQVPLQILVDDTNYRTVWTAWNLELFETRPVLVRDVQAGEVLGPELFSNERVQVDRPGTNRVLSSNMVVGAVAARNLPAQASIGNLDVHRPRVVQAGDSIFLQVRKGNISARVPAVVRVSGSLGDRIRILNLANDREMSAVLISRDVAELVLGS